MKETMDRDKELLKIVEKLKADGFDGLWTPEGPCGCRLTDFAPCGDSIKDIKGCNPGYQQMDPREEYRGNWAICKNKEPLSAEAWVNMDYC